MKMKKAKILIVAVVLCALIVGTHLLRSNYRAGKEMSYRAGQVSVQCWHLAKSMDSIEADYQSSDAEDYPVIAIRYAYDNAMDSMWYSVGWDAIPLADDVKLDIDQRIVKLRSQTMSDEDFEAFFTGKEKMEEIAGLRQELNIVVENLEDFRARHSKMSGWEQHVTSWKNEQNMMNERIRAGQSPAK